MSFKEFFSGPIGVFWIVVGSLLLICNVAAVSMLMA